MQIHELQPTIKKKTRKRIGRGGKKGTYSGKGMKGQKSRSGSNMQPVIRELLKRYPKLRGYRRTARNKVKTVNVHVLGQQFEDNEKITPAVLVQKRIVRREKGKIPAVKVLGNGEITKSLHIEFCEVSLAAKEKIEKAGGTII